MSKCPLIAKAIVYAARQAQLIDVYGMSWDAIEVNTGNILAGCSVPADGKMNSAEAVANRINVALRKAEDPGLVEHLQGVVTRQIASLRRIKGERDEARAERGIALEAMRIEAKAAQVARSRLAELEARNVELRVQLDIETARGDRLQRDRDGYCRGAQFWMDSSNDRQAERDAAESKLVKLRTYLEDVVRHPMSGDVNSLKHILEQTK